MRHEWRDGTTTSIGRAGARGTAAEKLGAADDDRRFRGIARPNNVITDQPLEAKIVTIVCDYHALGNCLLHKNAPQCISNQRPVLQAASKTHLPKETSKPIASEGEACFRKRRRRFHKFRFGILIG